MLKWMIVHEQLTRRTNYLISSISLSDGSAYESIWLLVILALEVWEKLYVEEKRLV